MNIVAGVLGALSFAALGVVWLVYPRAFRQFVVRGQDQGPSWNPFLPWLKTSNYIVVLRTLGLLCLSASALMVWAMLYGDR
jgi:hypothetical protein